MEERNSNINIIFHVLLPQSSTIVSNLQKDNLYMKSVTNIFHACEKCFHYNIFQKKYFYYLIVMLKNKITYKKFNDINKKSKNRILKKIYP